MHRIDTPSAVNGQFVDKNVSAGIPGTVCDASWLNAVQNEICNVIESAEITPSAEDNTQLNAAIKKIADSAAVKTVYESTTKQDAGVWWCKIGDEFQVKEGDVIDITVEIRWTDLNLNSDMEIRLVTPSITHVFCDIPDLITGTGYFSLRCVFKYHSDENDVVPGAAYFYCAYTGETSKYEFRLNGVISST